MRCFITNIWTLIDIPSILWKCVVYAGFYDSPKNVLEHQISALNHQLWVRESRGVMETNPAGNVNEVKLNKATIRSPVALVTRKGWMTVESKLGTCQHWSKSNIRTSDEVQQSRGTASIGFVFLKTYQMILAPLTFKIDMSGDTIFRFQNNPTKTPTQVMYQ